ncbi:MAG: sigma-70 family RNA polymerase sigma factor [Acidobacteriia bacterium]|nr:sigma-70 family RNA polymerase sigma factor [Terriglobia bacterium]
MNEPDNPGTAVGSMNHAAAETLLAARAALLDWLFARAAGTRWRLPRERFAEALARSAAKRFSGSAPAPQQVEEYLRELHLEDLALACACAEGCEAAWEHFVGAYRGPLRAAAGAILRSGADSAAACELADSLFAELYGLAESERGARSLFRYFHGRSSLHTWLRAVLAQRHVDALRQGKRFEPLEETPGGERAARAAPAAPTPVLDPDRSHYLALFRRALAAALARLEARDRERLALYYLGEETLAEIGRRLGEHESSVSRNLERIRRELRGTVEEFLRADEGPVDGAPARPGLSAAQVALCFEYALEDAPLDLGKALGARHEAAANGQES